MGSLIVRAVSWRIPKGLDELSLGIRRIRWRGKQSEKLTLGLKASSIWVSRWHGSGGRSRHSDELFLMTTGCGCGQSVYMQAGGG